MAAIIIASMGIWRSLHHIEQKVSSSTTDGNQSDADANSSDLEGFDKVSGLPLKKIQEFRRIYEMQKEEKRLFNAGWTFWDERVHMENIFCTRVNYLILCYSLFVAAFATLHDKTSQLVILVVVFFILFLISNFLIRAWKKLEIILKIIFNLYPEESNGLKKIDELVNQRFLSLPIKYNLLIGVVLPIILCLSFIFAFIAIYFGWWDTIQTEPSI